MYHSTTPINKQSASIDLMIFPPLYDWDIGVKPYTTNQSINDIPDWNAIFQHQLDKLLLPVSWVKADENS